MAYPASYLVIVLSKDMSLDVLELSFKFRCHSFHAFELLGGGGGGGSESKLKVEGRHVGLKSVN